MAGATWRLCARGTAAAQATFASGSDTTAAQAIFASGSETTAAAAAASTSSFKAAVKWCTVKCRL